MEEKIKKVGRPRKPIDESCNRHIVFDVNKEEKELFDTAFQSSGYKSKKKYFLDLVSGKSVDEEKRKTLVFLACKYMEISCVCEIVLKDLESLQMQYDTNTIKGIIENEKDIKEISDKLFSIVSKL